MKDVARGRAQRGASFLLLVGVPVVAAAWSCGDAQVVDTVDGSAKEAGSDAPALTCPSGKEPKDDPTCVTNDLGIFVSAVGSDADPGTKEKPVATLGAALTKAGVGGRGKVFVCEGSYAESVLIKATIGVYGGFRCADWSYSGVKPKFAGAKADYVVRVEGVAGLTLADLELDAKDGTPNIGESSIAVIVFASENVSLVRAKIVAGTGAKGTDGSLSPYVFPTQSELNGKSADADGGFGGKATFVTCPDGQKTTGGKGADIVNKNGDPGLPSLGGGAGGTAVGCLGSNTGGGNGAQGMSASSSPSPTAYGTLGQTWIPAAGSKGSSGSVGQGGGGGGSTAGAGGGGGAGACGGAGGDGGKGGGASIALASIASTIKVVDSELRSAGAGRGGDGAVGQSGQSPGGFVGVQSPPGCPGGNGGAGGAGGAGAGGSGGISVGLIYRGPRPNLDTLTQSKVVVGTEGARGIGGGGNDGMNGIAQAVLDCQAPLCL